MPTCLPCAQNITSSPAGCCCLLPLASLPSEQQPPQFEETHYPNPGLSRQARASADLIAPESTAELSPQHSLKAPTSPQRTDEKCRNGHGLIQEAGFPTADGANGRRNRGTPPAPSSSEQEAASGHPSSSSAPKPRATRRPPQLAAGATSNPQCTRGALQTKPRSLNPRLRQRRTAATSAPTSTRTRRRAQGTPGLTGSARSRPAPSTVRSPIRHRRPNRAARAPGGSWRKRLEAPECELTANPRGA
ncbi:unnamed protein product [Urochloa humidicola]